VNIDSQLLERRPADRSGAARAARLRLESFLTGTDLAALRRYLASIADLVDLTERKNTDLHRCARLLFANAAFRADAAELLGFSHRETPSDNDSKLAVRAALDAIAQA
jgi:hypothetical protein